MRLKRRRWEKAAKVFRKAALAFTVAVVPLLSSPSSAQPPRAQPPQSAQAQQHSRPDYTGQLKGAFEELKENVECASREDSEQATCGQRVKELLCEYGGLLTAHIDSAGLVGVNEDVCAFWPVVKEIRVYLEGNRDQITQVLNTQNTLNLQNCVDNAIRTADHYLRTTKAFYDTRCTQGFDVRFLSDEQALMEEQAGVQTVVVEGPPAIPPSDSSNSKVPVQVGRLASGGGDGNKELSSLRTSELNAQLYCRSGENDLCGGVLQRIGETVVRCGDDYGCRAEGVASRVLEYYNQLKEEAQDRGLNQDELDRRIERIEGILNELRNGNLSPEEEKEKYAELLDLLGFPGDAVAAAENVELRAETVQRARELWSFGLDLNLKLDDCGILAYVNAGSRPSADFCVRALQLANNARLVEVTLSRYLQVRLVPLYPRDKATVRGGTYYVAPDGSLVSERTPYSQEVLRGWTFSHTLSAQLVLPFSYALILTPYVQFYSRSSLRGLLGPVSYLSAAEGAPTRVVLSNSGVGVGGVSLSSPSSVVGPGWGVDVSTFRGQVWYARAFVEFLLGRSTLQFGPSFASLGGERPLYLVGANASINLPLLKWLSLQAAVSAEFAANREILGIGQGVSGNAFAGVGIDAGVLTLLLGAQCRTGNEYNGESGGCGGVARATINIDFSSNE